jgi:hypothetical protein
MAMIIGVGISFAAHQAPPPNVVGFATELFLAPGESASTNLAKTVDAVSIQGETTTYSAGTLTRAGLATNAGSAKVVHVTNLNNTGTGSLRTAIATSGTHPIVIVFDVGGVITLGSELAVSRSNTYIAGQTAPGKGILLKGKPLKIRASNVIVRGLMIRPGGVSNSADAQNQDGVGFIGSSNLSDMWIDQCDVMHSIDELCGVRTNQNYTLTRPAITNCLMIEPLRNPANAHEADHNLGVLLGRGSYDYLLADTIIAGTKARSPIVETGSRGCIFGVFTHDYQTGGSAGSGQMVPVLPLTKTNSEVSYLADKTVKFSISGMYAEPGNLTRVQSASFSPWMTWPGVDNGGQGYAIYERDNWFPAGWQSVATAVGSHGGTLPSSGKALPTPDLGSDALSAPQVWSHHRPTHGTETRAWTLAHAGARPAGRDAAAARLVTKLGAQIAKGVSGWSGSTFSATYASSVPVDTAPPTTLLAWSEPALPFATATNGLTNIENALDELMAGLGGARPRNVGRPIRPLKGGKLIVGRGGSVTFDTLTEFAGLVGSQTILVDVDYTDGTSDTVTITVAR